MHFDNRPAPNGRPEGGGRRRRSRRRRNFGDGAPPTPADVFAQPEFPQPVGPPLLSETQLAEMSKAELSELAKTFDVENPAKLKKDELVAAIVEIQAQRSGLEKANGVLDVLPEGYGFLRRDGYVTGAADIYISQSQIRRFELRRGDLVAGQVRAPKENEKYYGIVKVETINGIAPEALGPRPAFETLTPVPPAQRWELGGASDPAIRAIDVFAPLARGTRALLVAPPDADVAAVLVALGSAAAATAPDATVIALLLDQRPEDAIAYAETIECEVVTTSFDDAVELHVTTAELVLERAKRLTELGRDVVLLVDSLARLARLAASHGGRERPQNGVDPAIVQRAKRFFAAARACEEGGSLTMVASVPPGGGKLEHVLLEELGPMANSRIVISKPLVDARVVPPVDARASMTLREERLLSEIAHRKTVALRRAVRGLTDVEAGIRIADAISATKDADAFLASISADGQVATR